MTSITKWAPQSAYGMNREFVFSRNGIQGVKMPPISEVLRLLDEMINGAVSIEGVSSAVLSEITSHWLFREIERVENKYSPFDEIPIGKPPVNYVEFSAADFIHTIANKTPLLRSIFDTSVVSKEGNKNVVGMTLRLNFENSWSLKFPLYMSFITSSGDYYSLYRKLRSEGATITEFINLFNFVGEMEFDQIGETREEILYPVFCALKDVPSGTRMQWLWIAYDRFILNKEDVLEPSEDFSYVAQNISPEFTRELLESGVTFSFIRNALESGIDSEMIREMLGKSAA